MNDLSLLRISISPVDRAEVVPLALGDSRDVSIGDRVFTVGHPLSPLLGNEPRFNEGTVSSTFGPNDDPRMFQVSVPVQPGNSGSPLLDTSGRVVGVITQRLPDAQVVNFAVKVDYLSTLLRLLPDTDVGRVPERKLEEDLVDAVMPSIVLVKAHR